MRFMAFHALHKLSCSITVFQVTIGTRQMGMRTGDLFESLPHILVTGQAYRWNLITYRREWNNLRSMGSMAASTVVQRIVSVGGRGMTPGALRDNRICCGRMPLMAVETPQCITVSTTLFSYLPRGVNVTLDTI
jgi:hypothetical protein